jgi:hypothetical protein
MLVQETAAGGKYALIHLSALLMGHLRPKPATIKPNFSPRVGPNSVAAIAGGCGGRNWGDTASANRRPKLGPLFARGRAPCRLNTVGEFLR